MRTETAPGYRRCLLSSCLQPRRRRCGMVRLGFKKSRHGCSNCKKRHVKCDEQIPCRHCLRRGEECFRAPAIAHKKQLGVAPQRQICPKADPSVHHGKFGSSLIPHYGEMGSLLILSQPSLQPGFGMPSNGNWNGDDMFLMHHYSVYTSLTLSHITNIQRIWQTKVPEEAAECPPLMQALLAFSSFHLALSRPDQRQKYMASSIKHYGNAISSFCTILPAISEKNCSALFALASLIATRSMAEFAHSKGPQGPFISDLVTCLALTRGVRELLDNSPKGVVQGPFRNALRQQQYLREKPVIRTMPPHIRRRFDSLAKMANETCAGDTAALAICVDALERLEDVYGSVISISANVHQFDIGHVWKWVGVLSKDFLVLLRQSNPVALIILAHFAVLGSFCEDNWFHQGWSTNAIRAIRNAIGEHWIGWLSWPEQQITGKRPVLHITEELE